MNHLSNFTPLHTAENFDSLRESYDAWAESYDSDSRMLARTLPPVIAGYVGRTVPAHIRGPVLDVGCGTGVMGFILNAMGLGPIDGLDLSPQMLRVAGMKDVYHHLYEAAIGPDVLRIGDNAYPVVVASSLFTLGHAGPEGLDELIRITRPGGHIIFSTALPALDDTFHAQIQKLSDKDRWRLVEASAPFATQLNSTDAPDARVFVYRVL